MYKLSVSCTSYEKLTIYLLLYRYLWFFLNVFRDRTRARFDTSQVS